MAARTAGATENFSLAINYAVSGLHVWSYHAANLGIHILTALLLFSIVRRTLLLPSLLVGAGQAVIVRRGEWVQYSTPVEGGAEYIAVCLPAFSPDTVHRDEA